MPVWRCLVRGENFRLMVNGTPTLMGFYTTRWVEAGGADHAEQAALDLLTTDPYLEKPEWHDGSEPNAKVYFEEIEQVEASDIGSNSGFAWFDETAPE